MTFRRNPERRAGPRTNGFRFWRADGGGPGTRERILPTGRAQLIFDLDAASSTLVGPSFAPRDIERPQPRRLIGVVFAPGALASYVRPAATELADDSMALAEFWNLGSLLDELTELDAPSARRRIERELNKRRRAEDDGSAPAIEAARVIRSGASSEDVADAIGIDRRDLVPLFRRTVGVGIKRFARLQRFRRSMLAMRSVSPTSLATIAADHGYSDQAHLTRETQAFAGVSPTVLLGEPSTTPNHLPADRIFKTPRHTPSRMGP